MVAWETMTIGDLFEFKNGLNKGKEFFGQGTPIVNYMDVYKNRGLHTKQLKGRVTVSQDEIKRFDVQMGDMFFTRTSETPEEVGYASVMLDKIENCVFSGFVLRGRPITNKLDILYCQYAFMTEDIRKAIISGSTYTTRALTNGKQLSSIKIKLPKKSEQRLIATALSDTDDLIAALEKLIAKKRDIKQGVMQELLTGKRRLPGFGGKWVERANIFEFCKGSQHKALENGRYPHYNGGQTNSGFADDYNARDKIIISEGGNSCGFVNYISGKFWAGGHCYVVDDIGFEKKYLYNLLKLYEPQIMALRVGSGLPNVQSKGLKELPFWYTKNVEEQTAIARILSDMDSEIEALTIKLAKLNKIKQGMMSELLTGRIRLINKEGLGNGKD